MPHSSDDPPSAPRASVESETPEATVADAPEGANPAGSSLQDGDAQQPRRRRRRRRRRSPPAATSPGAAIRDQTTPEETAPAGDTIPDTNADAPGDADGDTGGNAQTPKPRRHRRRRRGPPRETSQESLGGAHVPVNESGPPDPATVTPVEDSTQAQPAPGMAGELPRPRRRRRRPARRPGLGDQTQSGGQSPSGPEAITADASPSEPGTVRRPWSGRPRNRRPPDRAAPDGDPRRHGPRQPREREARPGDAGAREPDRRDQGSDARGRRDRRSSGRPPGRGRETPARRPEQKLYALESVVDRGFEDVTEESNEGGEGGTRRVHWTIIKRTVADQKSGKPMSASYVLQREGLEAEFPNLGAARAAVNKTIVHPEKLTLSKAEHVAAKGSR